MGYGSLYTDLQTQSFLSDFLGLYLGSLPMGHFGMMITGNAYLSMTWKGRMCVIVPLKRRGT